MHFLQKASRRVVATFLISLLFFSMPISGFAFNDSIESEKKEVKQGITKFRINIRRLQQGITQQQEEVEKSLQQERVLLAEIENIDMRLHEQLEKLSVLEERMMTQQDLINFKERELDRAKGERHTVKNHLESRISAYYKMGRIGVINVSFSTKTLPELLQFHDSFQSLMRYDKNVIDTYRHTIVELERAKKALTLEQTLLTDFINQATEEKEKTHFIREEKEILLTQIKTKTGLQKQAIAEMEKAAKELTSSLVVLESKEEFLEQGVLLNKGKLHSPVAGRVIAKFSQVTSNRMGIQKKSQGLSIDATNGEKIHAIYDGIVIFAGYHRGYGNTVIIHHGFKYFTIISRIEKITVKKSEPVKTGDLIGLAGDTATLIEDGIYFEIRKEKQSLDPLNWVDQKNLIITSD